MICKVSSNSDHSMILKFYDSCSLTLDIHLLPCRSPEVHNEEAGWSSPGRGRGQQEEPAVCGRAERGVRAERLLPPHEPILVPCIPVLDWHQ